MPAYRPLDARFTGVVADATRRADELYRAGDLSGAMSALEGALAQSLTTPAPFPSWAVMRLAFVYRRLKRYPDEVELLERSLPHQTDEAARRRVLLRLAKSRSMVARVTPREPSRLIAPRDDAPRETARSRGDTSHVVMALQAATHHVGVEFLRAELEIAETMLTLAASSHDAAVRTRRYSRASEAAAEVMSHLVADGSPIRWTDAEHEELSRKLWSLARRIRAAADRRTLDSMFDALVPDASRRRHETNGGTADGPRA